MKFLLAWKLANQMISQGSLGTFSIVDKEVAYIS